MDIGEAKTIMRHIAAGGICADYEEMCGRIQAARVVLAELDRLEKRLCQSPPTEVGGLQEPD